MRPLEQEQIQAIWVDPTQFDPLRHGPPYLPSGTQSVKLAKEQRAVVRGLVKTAQVESEVHASLKAMAADYEGLYGWMSALLTSLRAAAVIHQTHHWQTRGQSFYGDHLLFERLYNDTVPAIDSVAERLVGLGGVALVDPVTQTRHLARCIAQCYEGSSGNLVQVSLHKEYKVLEAIKIVLGVLKNAGLLTDGTENLLQDIADKHEEFVYLLKQRDATSYSYGR